MKLGYFLSCEEWGPHDLVAQAAKAQDAGFHALWISDHFHPWNDAQGHSPFVWSVIGAIAQAAPGMHVTTAVTCPTVRIHPGVIAHAAATSAVMLVVFDVRFDVWLASGYGVSVAEVHRMFPTSLAPILTLALAVWVALFLFLTRKSLHPR